jgi:hypothetical protein
MAIELTALAILVMLLSAKVCLLTIVQKRLTSRLEGLEKLMTLFVEYQLKKEKHDTANV